MVERVPQVAPLEAGADLEGRIYELLGVIYELAAGNFQVRATQTERDDPIDGIAVGLNMLAEEFEATSVSRDYLERVIESMADGVAVIDTQGVIVIVNSALARVLDLPAAELRGSYANLVLERHGLMSILAGAEQVREENVVVRTRAGELPLHVSASRIFHRHGEPAGIVLVARDLSETQRVMALEAETRVERAKADELASMNSALLRAKQRAEAAERAKTEFLANVSHELRTPMNAVTAMTQMLAMSPLDATQSRYVRTIQKASELLLTLFSDLLEFSRLEVATMTLASEVLRADELISDVAQMVLPQARRKRLQLRTACAEAALVPVLGDGKRIRQILLNFVVNAVKFTDRGSVEMRAAVASSDERAVRLRLEVTDTGPGIPSERRAMIFEPFTQLDGSSTRAQTGIGLGLAICKKLTERMGGEIGVDTALGRGSTFWVTLPLPRAPELPAAVAAPTPEHHRVGRILVVDDHPTNREVSVALLEQLGQRADVASNGAQALEALQRQRYDLVLMDVQMPGMDGRAVTRAIRALPTDVRRVPVVALTAHASDRDREACLAAGMDGYLTKPIGLEALQDVLVGHGFGLTDVGRREAGVMIPGGALDAAALRSYEQVGGARLVSDIARSFLKSLRGDREALGRAVAEHDLNRVRQIAHRLRGSSLTIGAAAVARLCEQLGEAARRDDLPRVAILAGELDRACEASRAALLQLMASGEDERPASRA